MTNTLIEACSCAHLHLLLLRLDAPITGRRAEQTGNCKAALPAGWEATGCCATHYARARWLFFLLECSIRHMRCLRLGTGTRHSRTGIPERRFATGRSRTIARERWLASDPSGTVARERAFRNDGWRAIFRFGYPPPVRGPGGETLFTSGATGEAPMQWRHHV